MEKTKKFHDLNILSFQYKITEKYQFKNKLQRHISANISITVLQTYMNRWIAKVPRNRMMSKN